MGAKGQQTRQRLLEATAELVQTKPLRELTVSDITRRAKTATSTFYLYFPDASEAVLAVARGVSQSTPELLELLEAPWPADQIQAKAETFALSYAEHWQRHRAVFRVRNLAADEGDERFVAVRRHAISPLLNAAARRIQKNQEDGFVPADLHPHSTAGALLAMLERLSSVSYDTTNEYEVSPAKVLHAVAYFAQMLLGGGPKSL
jgi:AcrR family transcriptional regulator